MKKIIPQFTGSDEVKNFWIRNGSMWPVWRWQGLPGNEPFPDSAEWYIKAYKDAFASVPIFIMACSDSVSSVFDCLYGIDENGICITHVKEFLEAAKRGRKEDFRTLLNRSTACMNFRDA